MANTIPAWLVYIFILLPFYLLWIIYLIGISIENSKNQKVTIRYRKFWLYSIVAFQILTILSSPANCYGWKQGKACYSLIQALLTNVEDNPTHWIIESMFPVFFFLYLGSIVVLLVRIRIEKQQSNEESSTPR
jgi:hypothetical protein